MRTAEACQFCSQISATGKVVCVHTTIARSGVLKPRDYCETRCRMYVTIEGQQVSPAISCKPKTKAKPRSIAEYVLCIHRDRNNYEDRGKGCGRQARVYQCSLHGECYLHKPTKTEFPGVRECKSCPDVTLRQDQPSCHESSTQPKTS